MFSTSEKTTHSKPPVHQNNGGASFFRKAGEQIFFGAKENSAFFNAPIQPKLSVSSPDDPQEKEADTVAEHVMRMPEPVSLPAEKKDEKLQRKEEKEEEKIHAKSETPFISINRKEDNKELQAKLFSQIYRSENEAESDAANDSADAAITHTISRKSIPLHQSDVIQSSGRGPPAGFMHFAHNLSSSKGLGNTMPSATQQIMGSRFNTDFSGVRIHTDTNAENLSASINAQAFTHGNDIYFNSGKYAPGTRAGNALLAHELSHTIQQGKMVQQFKAPVKELPKTSNDIPAKNEVTKTPEQTPLNASKNIPPKQKTEAPSKKTAGENITGTAIQGKTGSSKSSAAGKKEKPQLSLLMPEPPSELNAASQKRLQQSQHKATQSAAIHSDLPPSDKNVKDARESVEEPKEESNAKAGDDLVAALGERPKPSPEITALCERIRQVIRDKRPPDEDSLVDAEPEGAAKEAGGELNENINNDVDKAGENYDDIKQTPDGKREKDPQNVEAPAKDVNAPDINAQNAVPDAIPPANISLDADVASSEQQINDAGMNSEPAKLVQEGPIAEAKKANDELKDTAASDPAAIEAAQKVQLAAAGKDMAALQAKALQALTSSRSNTIGSVGQGQTNMKESEEDKRTRVGKEAQQIFNDAQTQVNDLLNPLSADAMKKWEAGVDIASKKFKAALNKVKKWIDERHSGVGGFFVGIGDAIAGLPDWVTEEYDRAETEFGDDICTIITGISVDVNTVIATCEQLIKKAHTDIAKLFEDSFGKLDEWANNELKSFEKQLDGLHDKVTHTRDQLNKDMAAKASKSVQDVREEVSALRQKAKGMIGRIADAIAAFIDDPAKFIIEGLLSLLGIPIPAFWRLVNKIKSVISQIADDPIGFASNLMDALSKGFSQFTDNFGKHLLESILAWLTSGLGSVGVQLPKNFSLPSMITFFLQLMGITWERIRKLLAKHIGEENVEHIEKAYTLVSEFIEKGPEGIFEMIKQQLDPKTILDGILDAIISFVEAELLKRVAIELLKLFNPVGAILKAIEAIYAIFKWIFDNAARIFTLIETIVNGIGNIISGNIAGMATVIEKALAMLMVPIIDFFAELIGLGDLPQKVAELIKGFQNWIEGILDRVIGWLAAKAKALLKKLGIGKDEEPKEGDKLDDTETGKTISFTAGNESHKLWVDTSGNLVTVMMASGTPGKLTDKVKAIEEKLPENEKQKAAQKVTQVEQINTSIVSDGTQANKKIKEAQAEGHSKQNTTEAKAADNKVESEEQQLVEPVKELILLGGKPPVPKMKVSPEFSSAKSNGTITINYLYNDPENHSRGTDTTGREDLHGAFTEIERIGVTTNWKRGHLINSEFGGMALNSNLAPITTSINNGVYPAFDNRVRQLLHSTPKKVIWMKVTVERGHANDTEKLFISQLNAEAGTMDSPDTHNWQISHKEDVTPLNQSLNMPVPPVETLGINRLISGQITSNKEVRAVSSNNDISESVLRALIARNKILQSIDEIVDFVKDNPLWSEYKKARELNKINRARANGRITLN